MYLRPRTLAEKFLVEEKITRLDDRGRPAVEFKPTGEIIFGVISMATPTEVEKYKAVHHEISHVIVQRGGRPKAKVGDLLVKVDKKYLVQSVEDIAGMGQWINYFVNMRADL